MVDYVVIVEIPVRYYMTFSGMTRDQCISAAIKQAEDFLKEPYSHIQSLEVDEVQNPDATVTLISADELF